MKGCHVVRLHQRRKKTENYKNNKNTHKAKAVKLQTSLLNEGGSLSKRTPRQAHKKSSNGGFQSFMGGYVEEEKLSEGLLFFFL